MKKIVIFIRKKIPGENSIEEVCGRIARVIDATIVELPFESTKLYYFFKNILFARKHQGKVNHIINATEAYLLPFLKGKRIITYHDFGTLESSRNKFYRIMKYFFYIQPSKRHAEYITFVSEQTKNEYIKTTKSADSERLKVIYNSFDERLKYVPVVRKNYIPVILHIGTGTRKNLEGLLSAVKDLNVKIIIVGKLTDKQKELIINNNFIFENFVDVPFERIVELYNLCDIVSFPTFYEGFGLPIIEANVMQKPVISSDIPIIHEVGHNAVYYINPYDADSIKHAVLDLIENPTVYKNYVQHGLENAKRFEHTKIIEKYRRLYFEVKNDS